MGSPRGVIRPGFNLPVKVSSEREVSPSPPPGDVPKERKKKRARDDDGDVAAAAVASASRKDSVPAHFTSTVPKEIKKGKKGKKERQKQLMRHLSLKSEATTPVSSSSHPFQVDAADHCETPFQAYQDIEPFLFRIALALKKPKEKLRIYDPYFCEGSVAKHLSRLGFTNVYNKNEDFYKVIDDNEVPEHDVMLTNPPYSGDHFRRILQFAAANKKPWLLLLPNFVCRKNYYLPSLGLDEVIEGMGSMQSGKKQKHISTSTVDKPLFLIPNALKPYRYWAPGRKGFEDRNLAKGTTPFETFWYVHLGGLPGCGHAEIRSWWLKNFQAHSTCELPDVDEALPQQQRLQKRANPRARKIAAAKERASGTVGQSDKSAPTAGIYYDPAKAKKMAEQRREHQGSGKKKSKYEKFKEKKKQKARLGS